MPKNKNKKPANSKLDLTRKKLTKFIENNPFSTIEKIGEDIVIKKPWGDSSIIFDLSMKADSIDLVLNNLCLPPSFSAIYHIDTKDLEFIYTAFKSVDKNVKTRSFSFFYEKKEYKCNFSKASDRLLKIAEIAFPIDVSLTDHRNLRSLQLYNFESRQGKDIKFPVTDEPISFWIRDIEYNEDVITQLAHHMNFYMVYYDMKSPRIVFHSQNIENKTTQPPRYRDGAFSSKITARKIDDNLLRYWDASKKGNYFHRFIYSYRIIEYCAFSYIDSKAKSSIRKILATPNSLDNLDKVVDGVVGVLNSSKLNDDKKIEEFIEKTIDLKKIWLEVQRNLHAFNKDIKCDGGYVISAFADKMNEDEFTRSFAKFVTILRGIRNALSHGKDQKTSTVITPTHKNLITIQPWTFLASAIADEVMIYQGLH